MTDRKHEEPAAPSAPSERRPDPEATTTHPVPGGDGRPKVSEDLGAPSDGDEAARKAGTREGAAAGEKHDRRLK